MEAIRLGDANIFLKGIVEQRYYDPETGNIIGFDNVATDGAIETSVNLQEITGGDGNPVVGIIPDSTRMTGSYTSAAFSLETRKLITGGKLHYGGIAPVCETIVASGVELTVTGNPVKHYAQPMGDTTAWCYVKPVGAANYMGTNYGVDTSTKKVVNFTAVSGQSYEVFYWVQNASAEVLELPDMFNPEVVTIEQKYGVYSKQNNAVSNGSRIGYLYVIVPRASLTGNAGVSANQTTNATTDGSWMALSPDQNYMTCEDCGSSTKTFAYYIFVPCGNSTIAVENLAVVGGGVSVKEGGTAQIPVKYIMPDGSTVQPVYTDLTYSTGTQATATVNTSGQVTGVTAGTTQVTITLTKADGTALTAICNVVVTQ
jgi:hypothetical protein